MQPQQRPTPPPFPPILVDLPQKASPPTAPCVAVVFKEHRYEDGTPKTWYFAQIESGGSQPWTFTAAPQGLWRRLRRARRGGRAGLYHRQGQGLTQRPRVAVAARVTAGLERTAPGGARVWQIVHARRRVAQVQSGRECGPHPCRGRVYAPACPTHQGGNAAV